MSDMSSRLGFRLEIPGRTACLPLHVAIRSLPYTAHTFTMTLARHFSFALILGVAGCGSGAKTDAQFQAEIIANLNPIVIGKLHELNQGAISLRDAAPLPSDRGWDATVDQEAIGMMKNSWVQMRMAWESTESVLASLFPELGTVLDNRYEEFLAALPAGDADLFDGQGVIGMHAIERILYAPATPEVVAQESALAGYVAAAWPSTPEQAAELKNGLCTELVNDTQGLVTAWSPTSIDLNRAFDGLMGLMGEQQEKVSLAANHQDESRYAQRTLADLRQNLVGTRTIYDLFVPWLTAKPSGGAVDAQVGMAFDRLAAVYDTYDGDALPTPPPNLDLTMPLSPADQESPFGKLYLAVVQEVDPNRAGSTVDSLNRVAKMLGLPEFMAP
jgi:iron uptake system component EfeO